MPHLHSLDTPWKLLVTFFLIVLSCGFLVSERYVMHTTEPMDGKEGMSLDDITYMFHGDKKKTTLRKQVLGGMKKYFAEGGDLKNLTKEDQADIDAVIAWNDAGAPEKGYWDLEKKEDDKNPRAIINILFNNSCLDCHAPDATMKGNKRNSPLDTFEGISKFTKPDPGMDEGRLLMLSHVHLLGMGMMFLLAGAAVASTLWPAKLRSALIVGGMLSILLDIFGWWGVKYGGAAWSPVVMVAGILMAVCFGASVFAAMYDLWLRKVASQKA